MRSTTVRPASMQQTRISIQQAAHQFGVCERTIRRMISRGDLVGYRFGTRIIRLDPVEVQSLLRPIPAAGGGPDVAA